MAAPYCLLGLLTLLCFITHLIPCNILCSCINLLFIFSFSSQALQLPACPVVSPQTQTKPNTQSVLIKCLLKKGKKKGRKERKKDGKEEGRKASWPGVVNLLNDLGLHLSFPSYRNGATPPMTSSVPPATRLWVLSLRFQLPWGLLWPQLPSSTVSQGTRSADTGFLPGLSSHRADTRSQPHFQASVRRPAHLGQGPKTPC